MIRIIAYPSVPNDLSYSLQDRPDEVLDYISPLLDFALDHIPPSQVPETPLYILATAGMRLVEPAKRERIMARLRAGVNSKYAFLFPEDNLEIISGKQGSNTLIRTLHCGLRFHFVTFWSFWCQKSLSKCIIRIRIFSFISMSLASCTSRRTPYIDG